MNSNADKTNPNNEIEEYDFRDNPGKPIQSANEQKIEDKFYKEFSGELPSQQKSQKTILISICVFVTIVIIILFSAIMYIYILGTSFIGRKRLCPNIPQSEILKLPNKISADFDEKQAKWHNTIIFKEIAITLQAQCPTFSPDFDFYLNNQLFSRTVHTEADKFKILNCHGDQVYEATLGNGWDSEIFKNDRLSFQTRKNVNGSSKQDDHLFVKSTSLWSSDVEVLDRNGGVVANLRHKPEEKLLEISFNEKKYMSSDLKVFLTLLSKRFLKEPNDGCNKFFWGVSYFFMSVVGLIVAILLFFLIRGIRRWKKSRDLKKINEKEDYKQMTDEVKPKEEEAVKT